MLLMTHVVRLCFSNECAQRNDSGNMRRFRPGEPDCSAAAIRRLAGYYRRMGFERSQPGIVSTRCPRAHGVGARGVVTTSAVAGLLRPCFFHRGISAELQGVSAVPVREVDPSH